MSGEPRHERKYDAFISYNNEDHVIAERIHSRIQRLAKPWYRRRSIRVFRDSATLAASSKLWEPIEQALTDSRFLIVLASPGAAASRWVGREIEWWLRHRGPDAILLVVIDGVIAWDRARNGFSEESTSVPPVLRTAFKAEPHWIDLRGTVADSDAITAPLAAVFAAVTGRDKDDVIGDDLHQHARARRIAFGAVAVISLLAVGAAAAAWFAVWQRDAAIENERLATARALQSASRAERDTSLRRSLLTAASAGRIDDSPRSRSVLFEALSASPHLVRFVTQPVRVDVLEWLGDTTHLVHAGLDYLGVTDTVTGDRRRLSYVGAPTAASSAGSGDIFVVGTESGDVAGYRAGLDEPSWRVHVSDSPVVAIDVGGADDSLVSALTADHYVSVLRSADGARAATPVEVPAPAGSLSHVSFVRDGRDLVVGSDGGEVLELHGVDLNIMGEWTAWASTGDTYPESAFAADESVIRFVYGDLGMFRATAVWGTGVAAEFPEHDFVEPSTIALSRDGRSIAIDNDGELQVIRSADRVNTRGSHIDLPGTDSVDSTLAFSFDGRHLASTDGTAVAIWDLESVGGIVSTLGTLIPSTALSDTRTPAVATDAAATHLVWSQNLIGDFNGALVCWDTEADTERARLPWRPSALTLSPERQRVSTRTSTGIRSWVIEDGCPAETTEIPAPTETSILGFAALADGSFVFADYDGTLTRMLASGAIGQTWPSAEGQQFTPVRVIEVAPDGTHIAVGMRSGAVASYRLNGDELVHDWTNPHVGASPIVDVSYCTTDLVAVSDGDGSVVLLDRASGAVRSSWEARIGELACASDGRSLVGVGPLNRAYLWEIPGPHLLGSFDALPVGIDRTSDANIGRLASEFGMTLIPDDHLGIWFLMPGSAPTRWVLDPSRWPAAACAIAGVELTADEWRESVGTEPPAGPACVDDGGS